jgi:flagellar M-ring protein FliF
MLDLANLRRLWSSLEPKSQLTIVGGALLVLVTVVFLFSLGGRTSYVTLASNLDPADAGEVTQALESAGIGYKLQDGGTAIAVESGAEARARVALAESGLPRGGHVGFELFDKGSLGATDFEQKVDYQRALEGEIGRTIEAIDGVRSARVQLVLPEESLFIDEGTKASASVLLDGGESLDASTVRGVAHLVASSVQGLEAAAVTITGADGVLLWPTDAAAGGPSATARLQAEQTYGSQLAAQLNSLLTSTLGPGKAQARVHAALKLDQTTIDKVTYARRGVPLKQSTKEETLDAEGTTAAGPAGAGSNIPSYAGNAAGQGGSSEYRNRSDETEYGVDKTVESTVVTPGEVQKLDVALLVDKSVPPADVRAIEAAVRSTAGVDPERGDTLAVSRVTFAAPEELDEPSGASPLAPITSDPLGMLKYVGLGLAAAVFLFMMRRGIKRREGEAIAPEPTWLREIEAPTTLAELESGPVQPPVLDEAARRQQALREQAEEIARNQPEQIAHQVTAWMKE